VRAIASPKRIHLPDQLEFGFPPKMEDFFGEMSPPYNHKWKYQLWIEEWAEPYLGAVQFQSLLSRFASVSIIDEVVHEDREIFLIKSSANAADLKILLWQKFLEAATDAHTNPN